MSTYYKNVANRPFVPEKMNILRSAICATGIDWSRHSTQRCERFFMTQQPQAKYRHDYRAPDGTVANSRW